VVVTTVTPVVGGLGAATEAALLADVNARRATGTTCGGTPYPAVPPLTVSGILVNAAQGHANDMAARNYFSHTGTDGSDPGSRMEQAGYSLNAWAENIAAGQPSTGDVMASWWSSAGHCADFMNGAVSQIGFGMAQSSSSAYGIYWVADLANPA
jgi:uncharacterized protein YkwD